MRIAFDLDGTLIACGFAFPVIRKWPGKLMNFCGVESLREGTVELISYFQRQGNEVWIYTTSFRSPFYIHLLFLLHGIRINGVINQAVHNRRIKSRKDLPRCSKYPPAFAIDLLVDDQEGVRMEAERYGFQMIWIKPDDEAWISKVRAEYQKIKENNL